MNQTETALEIPYTYCLPMREDKPDFVDFTELRAEITDIMGTGYPRPLVTRLVTIIGGANGIEQCVDGITVHHAVQPNGQTAGVKAVSFWRTPLTVEQVSAQGRRLGPVAAQAVISFALRLHALSERARATSTDLAQ